MFLRQLQRGVLQESEIAFPFAHPTETVIKANNTKQNLRITFPHKPKHYD